MISEIARCLSVLTPVHHHTELVFNPLGNVQTAPTRCSQSAPTRHVCILYLFSKVASRLSSFLPVIFTACAVTVVIFGHFKNCSFYLLTYDVNALNNNKKNNYNRNNNNNNNKKMSIDMKSVCDLKTARCHLCLKYRGKNTVDRVDSNEYEPQCIALRSGFIAETVVNVWNCLQPSTLATFGSSIEVVDFKSFLKCDTD